MRPVPWEEVRRELNRRSDAAMKELLGCDLDKVERIRGRVEAYKAILSLEQRQPGDAPETVAFFDFPSGNGG